jgi:hypothetical protein
MPSDGKNHIAFGKVSWKFTPVMHQ